jgi:peptide chain release factor 1
MLDKLLPIEKRYEDLREQSMDPTIISDQQQSVAISRELSSLQDIYDLIQEYKVATQQVDDAKGMITSETDADMLDMAKEELKSGEETLEVLDQKIKIALLPRDPNDEKNIFLEIRPAAGGDEA